MVFADRRHAGRLLAGVLMPLAREHPIVMALPADGVSVGIEVARALRAPLDVLGVDRAWAHGAPLDARGRTIILVDDGLATGPARLDAVRGLRARGATRVVVAVPVAGADPVALLAGEADEVVSLTIPIAMLEDGPWYRDASPVPDEELVALLEIRRPLAVV